MEGEKVIILIILSSLSLLFNHLISHYVNRKTKYFDIGPLAKDHLYDPKIKLYKTIIALISVICASIITILIIEKFL
ncbi:hypothetical protein [Tissierella sp.]|uniref:hypothetical protein n=1 Tax=Tissierella sp. TaxID=41274 RepID=UPI00305DF9E9